MISTWKFLLALFTSFLTTEIAKGKTSYELRLSSAPEPVGLDDSYLRTRAKQFFDTEPHCQGSIKNFMLTTHDGVSFDVTLFDRNATEVIVLGQGLQGSKESMYYYSKIFPSHDLIAFDYRWNSMISYAANPAGLIHPLKYWLYSEQHEVEAILKYLKIYKNYTQTIGLGVCYSNFIFALTPGFDKLILDSPWHSLYGFAETISKDPWIPINPQYGGSPEWLKSMLTASVIRTPLLTVLRMMLPNVSMENLLKNLTIPVLFIYGSHDLMVTPEHLEALWRATSSPYKALFITPYEHANNAQDTFIYRYICSQFIQQDNLAAFAQSLA
jgi:pimeloyl-ACP methyl ester carboxylesterase